MGNIAVNDIYYYALQSKARIIIIYGGRDSGKSFFVGGQYIPLAMVQEKYFRGIAIRNTYASTKDSVFTEIVDGIDLLGLDNQFTTTKNPLEISHKNGNKMIFRGLDDPKKIKSLKGINFAWIEEAESLTEREFWDLVILLRGEGYQRLLMTFNPVDEEQFTNEMFVQSIPSKVYEYFDDGRKKVWTVPIKAEVDNKPIEIEALVICSTFEDNYFMPPVRKLIIEQLAKSDPYLYDVYRHGKYATKGGKILNNTELVDFESKGWEFDKFDNRGYGQDWGYNHASCTLWVAEKDNCLFVFDEIYEYEKDTDEYEEIMQNKGVSKRLTILSESAELDRVKTLRKKGYRVKEVNKYAGSVRDQIDKLKRYDKIYINTTCENTWKEQKAYMWKMNKQGKYTDEPIDVFDDAMAALRYSTDLFTSKGFKTMNRNIIF